MERSLPRKTSFRRDSEGDLQLESERRDLDVQRQEAENDLREVLKSPHGRRFLCRLMERTGYDGTLYSPSAQIHYNVAQRDVGKQLLEDIQALGRTEYLQFMEAQYDHGRRNAKPRRTTG